MRLLSKFFGTKEDVASIMLDAQRTVLGLFGVEQPTAAQELKISVYLCIAITAVLNQLVGTQAEHLIDLIAKESSSLLPSRRMPICDIVNDDEELAEVLATFPQNLNITAGTSINWLGAFDALYHAKAGRLVAAIWEHRDGPTNTQGYAAIVLARGLFGATEGDDRVAECFMPLMLHMNELAGRLFRVS